MSDVMVRHDIRPLATDELPVVIDLARRIWPTAYKGVLTPEQIENMLSIIYTPESLAQEMAGGHRFWLAYSDGEPAAYASAFTKGPALWIKKIYVLPALHGQGIGRALIDTVVSSYTNVQTLNLLANPHNAAAHRFYERAGFIKVGEQEVKMGDWHFMDFHFSKPLNQE